MFGTMTNGTGPPGPLTSDQPRPCPGNHPGGCTTGPTFERDEAQTELIAAGYTLVVGGATPGEWRRGGVRGALTWAPDYCNPGASQRGTRFWLDLRRRAYVPVLPPDPGRDAREATRIAVDIGPAEWSKEPNDRLRQLLERSGVPWQEVLDAAAAWLDVHPYAYDPPPAY